MMDMQFFPNGKPGMRILPTKLKKKPKQKKDNPKKNDYDEFDEKLERRMNIEEYL